MQVTTYRVADLPQNRPTPFDLRPDAATTQALLAELDVADLRKLRLWGEITARGKRDWQLNATLGATVVQPCVVTLAPVTTRIDTPLSRTYAADFNDPEGDEVEMPEDDTIEPLPEIIDLHAVLIEALQLHLPLYPKVEGVELGEAVFAAPGQAALRDEDTRPFSSLADLRDRMKKDG